MQDIMENGIVRRHLDTEVFTTAKDRLCIKTNEFRQPIGRVWDVRGSPPACLEDVDTDPMCLRRGGNKQGDKKKPLALNKWCFDDLPRRG